MTRISAVIPVLNEAPSLKAAIDRAWLAGVDEVIVCDGGSNDGSLAIAAQQPCRLIESPASRAVQQNRGAAVAGGDVLLFLHADTWLAPGAGDQMRAALADASLLCGGFRQQIECAGRVYRWLEQGNAARVRWLGLPYGDQGIFVRRETFDAVGGFPEIPLMEDLRLMRRLRRLSPPALLPGPLYVSPRRWQKQGVLKQTLCNCWLLTAERCGVSPERLKRFYPPHR
ncbi:MAG: glycosyltransferase [Planctomycetales bacterium]|nr:glycosyltransferase [Planctomycetales bacterium]